MVYIDANENTQQVYFPRNGFTPSGDLRLTAVSTIDRVEVEFTVFSWEVAGAFLRLVLGLPEDLFAGEWEFTLTDVSDASTAVAGGIVSVREEESATHQYNVTINYKQYGE